MFCLVCYKEVVTYVLKVRMIFLLSGSIVLPIECFLDDWHKGLALRRRLRIASIRCYLWQLLLRCRVLQRGCSFCFGDLSLLFQIRQVRVVGLF